MSNPHGSFIWYEYLTGDHATAKRFYDSVIGWNIEPEASNPMDYRMIRRADGGNAGGVMQINDEMREHGAKPTWLGYIGVDDVDGTVASAQAARARVLMPAFDLPGVGRMAMIADPQGATFYVMRPTPSTGAEDATSDVFSPDQPGHCAWNELSTPDLAAAKAFYPEMFGWSLGDAMPMGPMGDYQFIEHNGRTIGAMFSPPALGPMWRYCFRVADLEQAMEATRRGGGTITFGPDKVPTGDRIFQALDPEGAHFMCVAT